MADKDPFRDAISGFMKYLQLERSASPHTIDNYRRDICQFKELVLGEGAELTDATMDLAAAREFVMALRERELARNSILRKISSLRSFCRFLVREEVLMNNPFKSLNAPRKERGLPKVFSKEQVMELLRGLLGERWHQATKDQVELAARKSTGEPKDGP